MEELELVNDNAPWKLSVAAVLFKKLKEATGIIITRETSQRIAINNFIEDIKKSAYDPLMKAALISNAERIIKEYQNQNNIVAKAIPLLTKNANPEEIDNDWFLAFMDKARLFSEEEFQIIWSKILAEECNKPGSISKQLLMTLAQMDKVDAEVFVGICNFSLKVQTEIETSYHPLIDLTKIKTYYSKYNITSDKLRDLVALGLVDFEEHTESGFYLTEEKPILSIGYGEKLIKCSAPCYKIGVGAVILKKTGKELFKIITQISHPGFLDEIVIPYFNRYWKNEGIMQEIQNTLVELDKTVKNINKKK